jgi:hypothetical protein
MAHLTFNGHTHTLTLRDHGGRIIGTWPANNRTDHIATLRFVPNRDYTVQDTNAPNLHDTGDSINGEYGTQGIVRFYVHGHDGVGVHAGRETDPDHTPEHSIGPDHVTMGCIRTTEEAMITIVNTMGNDPLTSIRVVHNRNQRGHRHHRR